MCRKLWRGSGKGKEHRPVGKWNEESGPSVMESGPTEMGAENDGWGKNPEGERREGVRPDGNGKRKSGPTVQESGPAEMEAGNRRGTAEGTWNK